MMTGPGAREDTTFDLKAHKSLWVADFDLLAAKNRWGLAVSGIGWIHLASFGLCHLLHKTGDRQKILYLLIWAVELFLVLVIMRKLCGKGWHKPSPLAGLVARVWLTFLILSFNLASLNTLSGQTYEWFKPALGTLSTFGFMMMAYLISPWFFVAAVQMFFTGLLMVWSHDNSFLIYGVSWWLALQVIGVVLMRRRRQVLEAAGLIDPASQPVEIGSDRDPKGMYRRVQERVTSL